MTERRIKGFWKIYLIVFGILLVCGIVLIAILYNALADYEKNAQLKERQKAEYIQALEYEGNYANAVSVIDKCVATLKSVNNTVTQTEGYYISAYEKSAGVFARELIEDINKNGFERLCNTDGFLKNKFESPKNVAEFLNTEYKGKQASYAMSFDNGEYVLQLIVNGTPFANMNLVNKDGGWQIQDPTLFTGYNNYTVKCPREAQLSVNGIVLQSTEEYIRKEIESFGEYYLSSYTVEGLIARPEFCAVLNGQPLELSGDTFLYPSCGILDEKRESFEAFAILYGDYIADVIKFEGISPMIIAKSELYVRLRGFDTRWYPYFEELQKSDVQITDFQAYNEKLVSYCASYTQSLLIGGKVRRKVDVSVMIVCVLENGQWKIAEILTV